MSTRSQIRFVNEHNQESPVQVYRHSDGYPSGIIGTLQELEGTRRDPWYMAANFVLEGKLGGLRLSSEKLVQEGIERSGVDTDHDMIGVDDVTKVFDAALTMDALKEAASPYAFLGYGVENPADNIHGDEEYIYLVDLSDEETHVKVSKSRWDGGFESPAWETKDDEIRGYDYGEGEDAWTEATWDYEGPLAGAVEKYLGDE